VIGVWQAWHAGTFEGTTFSLPDTAESAAESAGCVMTLGHRESNEPRREGAVESVPSSCRISISETSCECLAGASFSSGQCGTVGPSLSIFLGMRAQPKPVYSKHAASPNKIACMLSDERGGQLIDGDGIGPTQWRQACRSGRTSGGSLQAGRGGLRGNKGTSSLQ